MISEKTKGAIEEAVKAISPEIDALAPGWWKVQDQLTKKAFALVAESEPYPTEMEECDAALDAFCMAVTYRLLLEMLKRA
jgi:hypothetical protein